MLTLLAFLVVIGVLVFVHELGHLIAAKSVDIEVPRFSVGFGPVIWGFRRGETEYVVSALPLGGYVRMAGMEDMAALEGGADAESVGTGRDFESKPLWARVWVVSAGVLMNFLFAVLVFGSLLYFYGEPYNPSTRIEITSAEELPPHAAALREVPAGAEVVAVGERRVGTWSELREALAEAPAGPTVLHFSNAPAATVELPPLGEPRTALLRPLQPYLPPVIGEAVLGEPAEQAGLRHGDRIVSAAGEEIASWSEFVRVVQAHPGVPLQLVVERDGRQLPLSVTPAVGRGEGDVEIGRLGVYPHVEAAYQDVSAGSALVGGGRMTWNVTSQIVGLLGDLVTGAASPRNLGGPLAIGQLSGRAARVGMEAFLHFMALLSVNLAVLNLLPIPVLDGGQLLFLGVEAVRGRPLSVEQRMRLSNVGLILVVGLMVWAITNDFLRFFGI